MNRKITVKRILCLLTVCILAVCLTGCGAKSNNYFTTLAEMHDMKLTIGYPDDVASLKDMILEICPEAALTPQNDIMALDAIETGKLDCYICGENYLNGYLEGHPDAELRILDEPLTVFYSALCLSDSCPIENFKERVNECILQLRSEGILDDMKKRWHSGTDEALPKISLPEAPEYTLKVATFGQSKPYSYVKNNELIGLDIEIAYRVASFLGCGIEFETASYPSMLMGISEGKYDIVASNVYITEERKQSVTFSEPYLEVPISIVTRKGPSASETYNTLDDLMNAKYFGNIAGSAADQITLEHYPHAEIREYNTLIDEVAALSAGKIDALLYDAPTLKYICAGDSGVKLLPGYVMEEDYHFVSAKNDAGIALMQEFNSWLEEKRADGTLDEMARFWESDSSPQGRIDTAFESVNGKTLVVGYDYTTRPDSFSFEGEPVGYSIELAVRFCRDNGYGIQLEPINMNAFINSLTSGKTDLQLGFLSYTEERAENVTYSNPVFSGGVVAVVRDESASVDNGWANISGSFRKTFITEERWKMLLDGLLVTAVITAGGFLLANLVGAGFCALAISKNRFLRRIEGFYSKIMQGTPIVVILMIFYYVIFGKSRINGIWVAIIGFGLSSGAGLSQLFNGGISAVDIGQREASLALGFTRAQTFFDIVLPQAVRTMLPGWFSELIALMKGTAIVGYIAVVDLTKTSDIIRSSTYEPFMPLIAVAVIYFLISCGLLNIMKLIRKKLAPKRRTAAEVQK